MEIYETHFVFPKEVCTAVLTQKWRFLGSGKIRENFKLFFCFIFSKKHVLYAQLKMALCRFRKNSRKFTELIFFCCIVFRFLTLFPRTAKNQSYTDSNPSSFGPKKGVA